MLLTHYLINIYLGPLGVVYYYFIFYLLDVIHYFVNLYLISYHKVPTFEHDYVYLYLFIVLHVQKHIAIYKQLI